MLTCFEDIRAHWGHDLESVTYGLGDPHPPVNAAIECVTCGVVLIDFDADPQPEPALRHEPLTTEELKALSADREDGFISVLVAVDDSDLLAGDLESFLDLISEKATGSGLLMEVSYKPVGIDNGSIVYEVSGDPSMILDIADNEADQTRNEW